MDAIMTKGEFIRNQRMEKKVRAVKVCEDINLAEATLYAMEVGTRGITPRIVEELINSIGIDEKYRNFLLYPEDILSREDMCKGEFFKLKRLDQGVNVTAFSEYTGVSVSLISCIENGTRSVTKKIYSKLAPKLAIGDISYEDFDACKLKVKIAYRMDRKYNIPIFGGVYLDDGTVDVNDVLDLTPNSDWKVKEYQLLDQSYKGKEAQEDMEVKM